MQDKVLELELEFPSIKKTIYYTPGEALSPAYPVSFLCAFLFAQTCDHVLRAYAALDWFIVFETDILLFILLQPNHVNY